MAKDRYTSKIKCPTCDNEAILYITENDGWSFSNRGAERIITRIEGSISKCNEEFKCGECGKKWGNSE